MQHGGLLLEMEGCDFHNTVPGGWYVVGSEWWALSGWWVAEWWAVAGRWVGGSCWWVVSGE